MPRKPVRLATLKPRLATLNTSLTAPSASLADRHIGSSTARGYGYRWQQARERFLKKHPLCRHCQQQGNLTPATVVDHITPHKGDQQLFWDEANWQPLCKPHHDVKTGLGG